MWRSDRTLVQKSLGREFGENTTPVSLRWHGIKAEKKMGQVAEIISALPESLRLRSPWLRLALEEPSSGSKFSNIFWLLIPMEPLASEIR